MAEEKKGEPSSQPQSPQSSTGLGVSDDALLYGILAAGGTLGVIGGFFGVRRGVKMATQHMSDATAGAGKSAAPAAPAAPVTAAPSSSPAGPSPVSAAFQGVRRRVEQSAPSASAGAGAAAGSAGKSSAGAAVAGGVDRKQVMNSVAVKHAGKAFLYGTLLCGATGALAVFAVCSYMDVWSVAEFSRRMKQIVPQQQQRFEGSTSWIRDKTASANAWFRSTGLGRWMKDEVSVAAAAGAGAGADAGAGQGAGAASSSSGSSSNNTQSSGGGGGGLSREDLELVRSTATSLGLRDAELGDVVAQAAKTPAAAAAGAAAASGAPAASSSSSSSPSSTSTVGAVANTFSKLARAFRGSSGAGTGSGGGRGAGGSDGAAASSS